MRLQYFPPIIIKFMLKHINQEVQRRSSKFDGQAKEVQSLNQNVKLRIKGLKTRLQMTDRRCIHCRQIQEKYQTKVEELRESNNIIQQLKLQHLKLVAKQRVGMPDEAKTKLSTRKSSSIRQSIMKCSQDTHNFYYLNNLEVITEKEELGLKAIEQETLRLKEKNDALLRLVKSHFSSKLSHSNGFQSQNKDEQLENGRSNEGYLPYQSHQKEITNFSYDSHEKQKSYCYLQKIQELEQRNNQLKELLMKVEQESISQKRVVFELQAKIIECSTQLQLIQNSKNNKNCQISELFKQNSKLKAQNNITSQRITELLKVKDQQQIQYKSLKSSYQCQKSKLQMQIVKLREDNRQNEKQITRLNKQIIETKHAVQRLQTMLQSQKQKEQDLKSKINQNQQRLQKINFQLNSERKIIEEIGIKLRQTNGLKQRAQCEKESLQIELSQLKQKYQTLFQNHKQIIKEKQIQMKIQIDLKQQQIKTVEKEREKLEHHLQQQLKLIQHKYQKLKQQLGQMESGIQAIHSNSINKFLQVVGATSETFSQKYSQIVNKLIIIQQKCALISIKLKSQKDLEKAAQNQIQLSQLNVHTMNVEIQNLNKKVSQLQLQLSQKIQECEQLSTQFIAFRTASQLKQSQLSDKILDLQMQILQRHQNSQAHQLERTMNSEQNAQAKEQPEYIKIYLNDNKGSFQPVNIPINQRDAKMASLEQNIGFSKSQQLPSQQIHYIRNIHQPTYEECKDKQQEKHKFISSLDMLLSEFFGQDYQNEQFSQTIKRHLEEMSAFDWSYFHLLNDCLTKIKDLQVAYSRHIEISKRILYRSNTQSDDDELYVASNITKEEMEQSENYY